MTVANYLTVKNGKYGNIDQESLQNITKINLMKKKKKEADDIDITMPRKRKDPVKTNTNKGKKTQKELDEDYELQMQSFKKDEYQQMNDEQKDAFLSMMYNFFKKWQDKNSPKTAVTEEKYKEIVTDKVTSNKPKKSKKTNNMTKKSNEEEKDKKKSLRKKKKKRDNLWKNN